MGRLLLLLTAGSALAFLVSARQGDDAGLRAARATSDAAGRALVREVTLSGHAAARHQAERDMAPDGRYDGPALVEGSYQGGTFGAEVAVTGTSVSIVTRGRHGAHAHVVRATYRLEGGTAAVPVPPPFMAGNIIANGNLVVVHPTIFGTAVPGVHASLHSNGNLEFRQYTNPSRVAGFGTHSGGLAMRSSQTVADVFQPVSNPSGLPLTARIPKITIPRFLADDHSHLAAEVRAGGWQPSGTIQLGTREAPRMIFVDGNFQPSGPIRFEGYGVLLVGGNAIFYHDAVTTAGVESPVGIYAEHNLEFRAGNINVDAQLIGGGNVIFDGSGTVRGGITAGGNLEFRSGMTVNYRPASQAITEPLWPGQSSAGTASGGSSRFVLARYSEGA